MAINPMQRRARNSFFIGFLVSLIIMAVVVLFLLREIKSLNEAKEALETAQTEVYVAAEDLTSGESITMEECFEMQTVRTTVDTEEILSSDDFEFLDEEGFPEPRYNDDGVQIYKNLKVKVDIPAGTIVTKDMVYEEGNETTDTQRIQEYNMIALPSNLKNGDHIDIRLTLPTGQDYIVLAKKEVIGTTATGLWLKLDEAEILTMNNAIVESYTIPGSKIYAIQYTEAGMQKASETTYMVSAAVLDMINNNPNITQVARDAIWARYNGPIRVNYFDTTLATYVQEPEDRDSAVESGFQDELQTVQAQREAFVESLEGTDEIGYNR